MEEKVDVSGTAYPSPSSSSPELQTLPAETAASPDTSVKIDNTIHEFEGQFLQASEDSFSESLAASKTIELVNAERIRNGLEALTYDERLLNAASLRAVEISFVFSHTRPDGSDCFSVFPGSYVYMGENLAEADKIISEGEFASGCTTFWMQSEGHRENILNSSYTHTAVAVYIKDRHIYAVQLFGTPY